MFNINRRTFIAGLTSVCSMPLAMSAAHADNTLNISFNHGVASGDPLQTKVIIWTRLSVNDSANENVETQAVSLVNWQLAIDENFNDITREGTTTTSDSRDFTVKVDVDQLSEGSTYYYRFICNDVISPIGRTRTLPEAGTEQAEIAVVSCSNYGYGYFNVYKELSNQTNLTAVLHLGDYIYEYANNIYSSAELVANDRSVMPLTETIALKDYRQRYASYRVDTQLQAAHAAHPFICVWDDHELANNAWQDGAENHQEDEGDWALRRDAAIQAYREWLPIRDPANGNESERTYRRFDIGSLASIIMLDTRLVGRSKAFDYRKDMIWQQIPFDMRPADTGQAPLVIKDSTEPIAEKHIKMVTVPFDIRQSPPRALTDWHQIKQLDFENLPEGYALLPDSERMQKEILNDPKRQLLGLDQERWLDDNLSDSTDKNIPWQIIGQQILMGKVCIPDISSLLNHKQGLSKPVTDAIINLGKLGLPFNSDAWDGYNVAKQRLLQSFKTNANNVISLAGDTHNGWAFNLTPDGDDSPVAVEMATPSVSSPGMENYLSNNDPIELSKQLVDGNPEMVYHNSHQRGWLHLSLRKDKCIGRWNYVSTVKTVDYDAFSGPSYTVKKGQHRLQKS